MTTPLLTLHVPMRAVSLNKYQRMFWAERQRHRHDTLMLVRSAMPMAVIQSEGWPVAEPVHIKVIAMMKPPILDADNVVVKDVLDALKGWVVADDDARYVEAVTPRVRKATEDRLIVEVWPASSNG